MRNLKIVTRIVTEKRRASCRAPSYRAAALPRGSMAPPEGRHWPQGCIVTGSRARRETRNGARRGSDEEATGELPSCRAAELRAAELPSCRAAEGQHGPAGGAPLAAGTPPAEPVK